MAYVNIVSLPQSIKFILSRAVFEALIKVTKWKVGQQTVSGDGPAGQSDLQYRTVQSLVFLVLGISPSQMKVMPSTQNRDKQNEAQKQALYS